MDRREFLAVTAATLAPEPTRPVPAQGTRSITIDGLGEVRIEYDVALLDEILASGLRGALVTVGNPTLNGPDAFDDMRKEIAAYERHVAAHGTRLQRVFSIADLDRAARLGTIGLVYYTQNATPIGDTATRLDDLSGLGVRVVQLTYNHRNLLGDGCLERTNAGLSHFGVEVVERMNASGMLIDVSHCGEATTLDAIATSRAPVAVSHAGCRAVFDHPRNKTDAALRALADKGGVIGIYQINPYLGPRERNDLGDYLAHLEHAVRVAGIEHVGIGSDREYRSIPDTDDERRKLEEELSRLRPSAQASFRWPFFLSELNHPRRMETIRRALEARRWAATDVDKVMGGNFYRLLKATIG